MEDQTMQAKRCSHCERSLPNAAFNKDRSHADGMASWCRECIHAAKRDHYRNNPEQYRARNERKPAAVKREVVYRWKRNHPELVAEMHRSQRQRLTDGAVRSMLTNGTSMRNQDIPQALVEAKRLQLQITRLVKELNDEDSTATSQ